MMNHPNEKKRRRCLGCYKFFDSSSAGNRFCPRCRKNRAKRSFGMEPHSDQELLDLSDTILSRYSPR